MSVEERRDRIDHLSRVIIDHLNAGIGVKFSDVVRSAKLKYGVGDTTANDYVKTALGDKLFARAGMIMIKPKLTANPEEDTE